MTNSSDFLDREPLKLVVLAESRLARQAVAQRPRQLTSNLENEIQIYSLGAFHLWLRDKAGNE